MLGLAGGAWAVTALLDSPGSQPATIADGSSAPPAAIGSSVPPAATTATPVSRPIYWLGMQIETLPPGAAVIDTAGPGSPAGLQPGDVILEINHQPINGSSDIAAAIQGLGAGNVVEMQISHGSALYQTEVTLGTPPSASP